MITKTLEIILLGASIAMAGCDAAARTLPAGQRYALLVGIADYRAIPDLEGPVNDVEALAAVLQRRWGFPADHIEVLRDGQATKAAILRAIATLSDKVHRRDHVFIYFSGHGLSAKTPGAQAYELPYTSGASLPADMPGSDAAPAAQRAGLIVGKSDLRPLFARLDRRAGDVVIMFDSCYSANAGRGTRAGVPSSAALPVRSPAGLNPAMDEEAEDSFASGMSAETYPYRHTVIFSAAGAAESAKDLRRIDLPRYPTLDGKPHGAFSDALLRVLQGEQAADRDHDGHLAYGEIYAALRDFMLERGYGHTPRMLPKPTQEAGGGGPPGGRRRSNLRRSNLRRSNPRRPKPRRIPCCVSRWPGNRGRPCARPWNACRGCVRPRRRSCPCGARGIRWNGPTARGIWWLRCRPGPPNGC